MIRVTYRHEGDENVVETDDTEEFLTLVDRIQYVFKGAELISVTNNGQPVPMIRGW